MSILILLFNNVFGCSNEAPSGPSDASIALYDGRGVWEEGLQTIESVLSAEGYNCSRLSSDDICRGNLDRTYALLIIPGGKSGFYNSDLFGKGIEEIRNFTLEGGGFIGICAGAFFAMDRIVWYEREYDYLLDLVDGCGTGPLDELANPGEPEWVELRIGEGHPACGLDSGLVPGYYFDGPAFDAPGSEIFAWYKKIDAPAALTASYGEGRIALTGFHPEMSVETEDLLLSMAAWTAGTSASRKVNIPYRKRQEIISREVGDN